MPSARAPAILADKVAPILEPGSGLEPGSRIDLARPPENLVNQVRKHREPGSSVARNFDGLSVTGTTRANRDAGDREHRRDPEHQPEESSSTETGASRAGGDHGSNRARGGWTTRHRCRRLDRCLRLRLRLRLRLLRRAAAARRRRCRARPVRRLSSRSRRARTRARSPGDRRSGGGRDLLDVLQDSRVARRRGRRGERSRSPCGTDDRGTTHEQSALCGKRPRMLSKGSRDEQRHALVL